MFFADRLEQTAKVGNLRRQFGKKLRSIRERLDMTQERFAELLGVSVDFLSLVERGINAPSFESMEAFSIALGIPVKDFFDFTNEASSKHRGHPS